MENDALWKLESFLEATGIEYDSDISEGRPLITIDVWIDALHEVRFVFHESGRLLKHYLLKNGEALYGAK